MTVLLFGALWVHIAASVLLTGAFSVLLLAGPPPNPGMRRWEQRVLSWARRLVAIALLSGFVWLASRTAEFEGRPGAALEVPAIWHAMTETWPGQVWMARHGLLVILAAFLLLDGDVSARRDWFAARGEAFLLAALALIFLAGSGHAAAISDSLWPPAVDMVHLLGAGIWVGGLPPLALLLYGASCDGTTPDLYAVRTMRRFSRVALCTVLVLAGSGIAAAWLLVGGMAGLVGTTHGHLLLAKLAVLVPVLLLAAASRARLPALSDPNAGSSSPTARRMALFIAFEALLVLVLLGLAAAMTVTTPGTHGDPVWPWPYRLSLGASPEIVEAYPTSFARPPITYHAGSIKQGMALYTSHCESCHGALLAPQTTRRSAGDLFWLITHGRVERGMPEFGSNLQEAERWHLINALRAMSAAADPRRIGPKVDVDNAWLAAPDFTITVGPLTPKALSDYRGQRMVLLVLYDLPGSRDRMTDLARHYGLLSVLGVEVVAVPSRSSPNAIAELGASPPVLFPVVTDSNEDIAATYRLFAPGAAHAEVLIDRQGYIRAIWRSDISGMPDAAEVQAQVEILNAEKAPPPLPDDHVH